MGCLCALVVLVLPDRPSPSISPRLRATVRLLDAWLAAPDRPPVSLDHVSRLVEEYISRLSIQSVVVNEAPLDADSQRQLRLEHPVLKFCLVHHRGFLEERSQSSSSRLVARIGSLRRLLRCFGARAIVCLSLSLFLDLAVRRG